MYMLYLCMITSAVRDRVDCKYEFHSVFEF